MPVNDLLLAKAFGARSASNIAVCVFWCQRKTDQTAQAFAVRTAFGERLAATCTNLRPCHARGTRLHCVCILAGGDAVGVIGCHENTVVLAML